MRADRGTWDASVGLSELMRDSIFSASLLQASIWKEKTLLLWDLRASTVQSSKLQAYVQRKLARGRLLSSTLLSWPESQVTMALTYYTYEGISGGQKLQCSNPVCGLAPPHPACVTGCHSYGQAVTGRFTCFEREDRSRLGPRQLEWLSLPLKSTLPSDKTWAYMSEAPHR